MALTTVRKEADEAYVATVYSAFSLSIHGFTECNGSYYEACGPNIKDSLLELRGVLLSDIKILNSMLSATTELLNNEEEKEKEEKWKERA